jgi:hypothetical protein
MERKSRKERHAENLKRFLTTVLGIMMWILIGMTFSLGGCTTTQTHWVPGETYSEHCSTPACAHKFWGTLAKEAYWATSAVPFELTTPHGSFHGEAWVGDGCAIFEGYTVEGDVRTPWRQRHCDPSLSEMSPMEREAYKRGQ